MSQKLIAEPQDGHRIVARYDAFDIATDKSVAAGGQGSAPEPFDLFLASIATCSLAYVMAFCRQRDIPTDGVRVVQSWSRGEGNRLARIELDIDLPEGFPEKYRTAVVRAAEQCSIKKVLADPPEVVTRVSGS